MNIKTNKTIFKRQTIDRSILFVCVFLGGLIFLFNTSHTGDQQCWIDWATYMHKHGLGSAYNGSTDYPPMYLYVLYAYAKFCGTEVAIVANIQSLKWVTALFHLSSCYLIMRWVNAARGADLGFLPFSIALVFNVGLLYNFLIWGQVDAIFSAFVLFSLYAAVKEKVVLSLLSYVIAVNFKLQAIVFLPLIGLVLLPTMVQFFSPKKVLLWLIVPILLKFAIVLPFILGHSFQGLIAVVFNSVGKYPYISVNAYNLWYMLSLDYLAADATLWHGLSYKTWGLLLFCLSSGLALTPLAVWAYKRLFKNGKNAFHQSPQILLIAALISLCFYFFNTEMHERYSHPALLFLGGYALYYKRYVSLSILTTAYFLNLEDCIHFLKLNNYKTVIFDPLFIAALYALAIVIACVALMKDLKANASL